ncbi:related to light induced alcohol dehydrogenase Bli-4 [Phialocephala subalpina]|uniref:Related to light induced alcohol dehydrogenase Bli-4 n=1 Tax=Phialocephala subalpina TaxID=576137 RepID=A0A1L7XUJ1_9HELO|nr:related to light induced alcohol dehydrogenase Bli-4 [Phialocephala subalpina]
MGGTLAQIFPPAPSFTEKNLPSLKGNVYIVTGGNAGVGLELVKFLYSAGGIVYIASRTASKITAAISDIKTQYPSSSGTLKPLALDLSDLTTVPIAASQFLAQESRLDVLFNNAGIAHVPAGSVSKQGHEAHMGTNVLGHFLFTKLLTPILIATSKISLPGTVRIVWTTSSIIDMSGPPGGLSMSELVPGQYSQDKARNYSSSKAANWFLASEFSNHLSSHSIISISQNPGNLRTAAWNGIPWLVRKVMSVVLYEPKMGAYTELWCGLSPDVKLEDGGRMAIPWGRWHPDPRKDILESLKGEKEGGTGLAAEFWGWCEKETKEYSKSTW